MTFAATILSTKILKPSLVDKAMAHGIEIIEKSFIKTQSVAFNYQEQEETDCLVFTSINAVRAISGTAVSLGGKKIACTSGETKRALQDLQFNIDFEANDAHTLANQLVKGGVKSVAFFCGTLHRDELPHTLRANSIKVQEVVVYETILTPTAIQTQLNGILFFSPSAVDSFLSSNTISDTCQCFCIGLTTSDHLKAKTKATIHTATSPSQENLIDLLIKYYTHEVHVKE